MAAAADFHRDFLIPAQYRLAVRPVLPEALFGEQSAFILLSTDSIAQFAGFVNRLSKKSPAENRFRVTVQPTFGTISPKPSLLGKGDRRSGG